MIYLYLCLSLWFLVGFISIMFLIIYDEGEFRIKDSSWCFVGGLFGLITILCVFFTLLDLSDFGNKVIFKKKVKMNDEGRVMKNV